METPKAPTQETRQELLAKGYPPSLVEAALERAIGVASAHARPFSEELRSRVFTIWLSEELRDAAEWCRRMQQALDESSPLS